MPPIGSTKYNKRQKKKRNNAFKHVPHSKKPPLIVAKRNARERKRVNKITDAFERLREHVPHLIKDRKLSKFETLQMAMAYIDALDKALRANTSGLESAPLSNAASRARVVVAQSSAKWRLQRWLENKLGMSKKI